MQGLHGSGTSPKSGHPPQLSSPRRGGRPVWRGSIEDGAVPRSERLSAAEALAAMVPAVREAGEIGLRFAREGAKTFTKHDASPVTEADLAIDAHLAARLRGATQAAGW